MPPKPVVVLESSGVNLCLDGFHEIQNDVNYGRIADGGVDEGVVNGAVRPLDVEILLDEIDALAVDGIHELLGFLGILAASQQAAHFIFPGSVKKYTQGIRAVPEKMLRPPADDDRVAGFRGVLNDPFGKFQNAFAVDHVELVGIQAAFITPAQEGFEESVVHGIRAFLANLDDGLGAVGKPGDLLGQQLIPKLPAQLVRKALSDFSAATSVLTFNGYDIDHVGPYAGDFDCSLS